jgi:hypothetical protein
MFGDQSYMISLIVGEQSSLLHEDLDLRKLSRSQTLLSMTTYIRQKQAMHKGSGFDH